MKKTLCILTLILCFVVTGQAGQEPQMLAPGKPIEREVQETNRTAIKSALRRGNSCASAASSGG